jgi:imidazolonepropionase-like amidohydrolase
MAAGGRAPRVPAFRAAVRARADRGADHIKIFTTGGVSSVNSTLTESNYSAEEITAVVDEAAAAGLTVSAHALGGPGVDLAVENGIHSIEHGTLLDPGNIERMVAVHTWLVLTTTILFRPEGVEHGDGRVPEIMSKLTTARECMTGNLAAVRESGIPFAIGTDSMHGLFEHEMQWLVEHGWSAQEALVAGTRHGGELIGDPTVGVLAEGSRADFVVLGSSPFDDIRAVCEVEKVYRSGQCVVDADHARPLSTTGG